MGADHAALTGLFHSWGREDFFKWTNLLTAASELPQPLNDLFEGYLVPLNESSMLCLQLSPEDRCNRFRLWNPCSCISVHGPASTTFIANKGVECIRAQTVRLNNSWTSSSQRE